MNGDLLVNVARPILAEWVLAGVLLGLLFAAIGGVIGYICTEYKSTGLWVLGVVVVPLVILVASLVVTGILYDAAWDRYRDLIGRPR